MPHDILDTFDDTKDIIDFKVGRNIRQLKRYGLFYRRLRSKRRFGTLFQRIVDAGMADGGDVLGVIGAIGTAIRQAFRRKTPAQS